MGMFDFVKCEAKLPEGAEDLHDVELQTKDTPAQFLDTYVISKEGLLYHIDYDIEDRSDPNAEGIARMFGSMMRVNERQAPSDFTGRIKFYGRPNVTKEFKTVAATFDKGKLTGPMELVLN